MALRKILQHPDPALRKICKPVREITPHIKQIIEDMKETMTNADGCGLAAPQIGILRSIVVINVGDGFYEMINPVVTHTEGEQTGEEGCLSCVGRSGIVTRPMKATVHYTDLNGDEQVLTGEGLLARAICHETDHLDGKLYIDILEREILEDE